MLDLAYKIACKVHENQLDKGGNPYILHPIAVSEMVDTEDEKIVALLHDTVEDTSITFEELKDYGFSNEIIIAIKAITKIKGESYEDYIDRVKDNPIALKVKIADLKHNMDLRRIPNPSRKDHERVRKYINTLKVLSTC